MNVDEDGGVLGVLSSYKIKNESYIRNFYNCLGRSLGQAGFLRGKGAAESHWKLICKMHSY